MSLSRENSGVLSASPSLVFLASSLSLQPGDNPRCTRSLSQQKPQIACLLSSEMTAITEQNLSGAQPGAASHQLVILQEPRLLGTLGTRKDLERDSLLFFKLSKDLAAVRYIRQSGLLVLAFFHPTFSSILYDDGSKT